MSFELDLFRIVFFFLVVYCEYFGMVFWKLRLDWVGGWLVWHFVAKAGYTRIGLIEVYTYRSIVLSALR